MAEINNNIPNFGRNNKIEKIDKSHKQAEVSNEVAKNEIAEEKNIVPDTGVLGRSQVRTTKGADVSASVNEAVLMATEHETLMNCGEDIFDSVYTQMLNSGVDPAQAYINATLAEEEFYAISK